MSRYHIRIWRTPDGLWHVEGWEWAGGWREYSGTAPTMQEAFALLGPDWQEPPE